MNACHEQGIVNPDMASIGNVVYNKRTKLVHFTDYQDMQVRQIPSSVISSFIAFDPVILERKYTIGEMSTPNLDYYTLATRFFNYATRINVSKSIHTSDINDLLDLAGASKTSFGDCMRVLYDPYKNNIDIREPILELCRDYELAPFQEGYARRLIKK